MLVTQNKSTLCVNQALTNEAFKTQHFLPKFLAIDVHLYENLKAVRATASHQVVVNILTCHCVLACMTDTSIQKH